MIRVFQQFTEARFPNLNTQKGQYLQINLFIMQSNKNCFSIAPNDRLTSLLSVQTAAFLKSYQFLEHQSFTPLCKTQIPTISRHQAPKTNLQAQKTQIQCPESEERRVVVKKQTASHAMQDLVITQSQNLTSFGQIVESAKSGNHIQHEASSFKQVQALDVQKQKQKDQKRGLKAQEKSSEYEEQLSKAKALIKQQSKQCQFSSFIPLLIHKIEKVSQTEFKLQKLQHQYSLLEHSYKELEMKIKQRMVVNLELQALMVSLNMKSDQKIKELKGVIVSLQNALVEKEKHYEVKIKQIKQQFENAKKIGQQQINFLIAQLKKSNFELTKLKQKPAIIEKEPIFDKLVIQTKRSNHFMGNSMQKNGKTRAKNIKIEKQKVVLDYLSSQPKQMRQKAEKIDPNSGLESLNLQKTHIFGRNRPFCKTERV